MEGKHNTMICTILWPLSRSSKIQMYYFNT